MRVRRVAGGRGVGEGRCRDVEIKVSYAPAEYAVVAGVAELQGWTVGGWVAGIAECTERIAEAPQGGGLEGVAWGRARERAGSIAAGGRVLGLHGAGDPAARLVHIAERVEVLCGTQIVAVQGRGTQANLDAARVGELAAHRLGPRGRPRGVTGQRRRVKVVMTENAAYVVRQTAGGAGWAVADWVGTVCAGAAGWLAVHSRGGLATEVHPWRERLEHVRSALLTALPAAGRPASDREHLVRIATWAAGEVAMVESGLIELAAAHARDGARDRDVVAADLDAVFTRLGWQGTQLAFDVRPQVHPETTIETVGAR